MLLVADLSPISSIVATRTNGGSRELVAIQCVSRDENATRSTKGGSVFVPVVVVLGVQVPVVQIVDVVSMRDGLMSAARTMHVFVM